MNRKRVMDKGDRARAMALLSDEQREAYNALGLEAVALEIEAGNLRRRADNCRLARTRQKNKLVHRLGIARGEAAKRAKAAFNPTITEYARQGRAKWKSAQKKRAAMDALLRGVLKDAKACGVLREMARKEKGFTTRDHRDHRDGAGVKTDRNSVLSVCSVVNGSGVPDGQ